MIRQINGYHVLFVFVTAFSIIIAVNLTLAYNAVRTFPGLEVKNSYVASQKFDAERAAQLALGWTPHAEVTDGVLRLTGLPSEAFIEKAIFGRATSTAADQTPAFVWTGTGYEAPVETSGGNYNLRLEARAADGTVFKQRLIVEMKR